MASTAIAPRSARGRIDLASVALGGVGFAALAIVLESLPRLGLVDRDSFPSILQTADALVRLLGEGEFWTALGDTLRGWSIGLLLAVAAGSAVGVAIGTNRRVRDVTASTIEFLRPIPSVALIPLAVVLYGAEPQATLIIVVYASFWQVLVQTIYGVQDTDPVALDTARSYGLGLRWRLRAVVVPSAMPFIVTGIRLAAAVALILEITGELIIGSPGLGRLLATAQTAGQQDVVFALVVVSGLLGVSVNLLARAFERSVLAWHPSVRGELH